MSNCGYEYSVCWLHEGKLLSYLIGNLERATKFLDILGDCPKKIVCGRMLYSDDDDFSKNKALVAKFLENKHEELLDSSDFINEECKIFFNLK